MREQGFRAAEPLRPPDFAGSTFPAKPGPFGFAFFRRLRLFRLHAYAYELCLATAGKQVSSGPGWIHEVKHDGYRMLVITNACDFSRNGTDWTERYPWIAEPALKNRQRHFVTDGEAVVHGVDGVSDFNAQHARKHDHEVQLYAFDIDANGLIVSAVMGMLLFLSQACAPRPPQQVIVQVVWSRDSNDR